MNTLRRPPKRRQGTILVIALVLLTVFLMLGASLTKGVLLGHDQLHRAEWRQQASWLADAGLKRGLRAIQRDPDYQGESWEVAAESLDGTSDGRVEIRVESNSDADRHMSIEAIYPATGSRQVVLRRTLPIPREREQTSDEQALRS